MNIIRFIDCPDNHDGVIVDMEYTFSKDSVIKLVDLQARNIINSIVGEPVNVSPAIKLVFASNLLSFLEDEHYNK